MEKLKYPENVDYVMRKYGEQIKQAFIKQNEIVRQTKRSPRTPRKNKRENSERRNYCSKLYKRKRI